jgi:hypothetical protein
MTSEFDPLAQTPDNDNGFEKLDIQSEAAAKSQEEVFSSTHQEKPSKMATSEVSSSTPLIDLGAGGDRASDNALPVKDLLLWTNPKKSGAVLATLLVILISLACCSLLSVIAYLSMTVLSVSFTFVLYKKIMAAIQKTNEGHPFQSYLEVKVDLPKEKLHELADDSMKHVSCAITTLRRYFLIEDIVDSLKFFLMLWLLSYVGAWFNTLTLIIIDVVALFTIPKFYVTYQTQLDEKFKMLNDKANEIWKIVRAKIPIGKKDKKDKAE